MIRIENAKALLLAVFAMAFIPITVSAQSVRHFGLGMSGPLQLHDLPASRLRSKLERLPARKRKKSIDALRKFSFTDKDLAYLDADNNGRVLFVDRFLLPAAPSTAIAKGDMQVPLISARDAFSLHSRPGAKRIIYLDFNGMDVSNTAWNEGAATTFQAQAYDTDGSPETFSASELNSIAEIWHRIAEDYMPFNVDVTTKEPKTFGPTVGRILITRNVDKNGVDMPYSSAGGVAYVGYWGTPIYTYASPALVYYNNLSGGSAPVVAEASSHEMGHNLGLAHDGTPSDSYYDGQGTGFVSWAPIMGNSYSKNVTQWSKGEYLDANNTQDDISIIKTNLGYRPDDHGNTLDTATPLVIGANGLIAATNPETDPYNADKSNKGVIGRLNDADYFSFYANAGTINITVTPAWGAFYNSGHRGANLDVLATLHRWDGKLIQKSDPINETKAVIAKAVPAGQYFLAIRGTGNTVTPYSKYDSLGQYFINGTVAP